jgi:tetratricopeptide (TPR) repeat protein
VTVIAHLEPEGPRRGPAESPAAVLARARERFDLQDYHGTVATCEALLEGGRAFADVHHLHGAALALLGQHERALASFDAALALNPRYLEALVHRALALSALGRGDEAAAALQHAAHLAPPMVEGMPSAVASRIANQHAALARAYEEAGQAERAAEQYRRALELGPAYHDLRYRLGRVLLEAGRPLEAREELERVAAAAPAFLEARAALGLAHHLAGDALAARRTWQACLAERPGFARAQAYLAMLERAAG